MSGRIRTPQWFVPGDIDGFVALGFNLLLNFLVVISLMKGVLGYSEELIYRNVLPGMAVGLLIGNSYYAWQCYTTARRQGRDDMTALPYGVNSVSIIAFVFIAMLPAKLAALDQGFSEAAANQLSYHVGLVACLGSGVIEVGGASAAAVLRRFLPRACLLASLSGIGLGYLALTYLTQVYAYPVVGLGTLAMILVNYYGGLKLPLPPGLVTLVLGIVLAWAQGLIQLDPSGWQQGFSQLGFYPPTVQFSAIWHNLGQITPYLGVVIPMGMFNLFGSMQCIESAEAAGDKYATMPSLVVNGIGSLASALFGSPVPTTLFIGHPGWKDIGSRVGYSWLTGVIFCLITFFGLFGLISEIIPPQVAIAFLVYIGITITAQAFETTAQRYTPAVVMGILPGIAGWGTLLLNAGLQIGAAPTGETPFSQDTLAALHQNYVWAGGLFALDQGQIVTSVLLSALMVYIIDKRYLAAALCSTLAAVLSFSGAIHAWMLTPTGPSLQLGFGSGGSWSAGYAVMTAVLIAAHFCKPDSRGPD